MFDEELLLFNGLSFEIMTELSYPTKLGKSLKNSLRKFDKDLLINEMIDMTGWLLEQEILSEIALDYRIKSVDSILRKYEKYYPDQQVRKVFNDILGFRAFCDGYSDILSLKSETYRIVDMTNGKANDDGYRGVHLYFQLDNFHYPIEIQFNTYYDRQINNWLHDFLYKKDYPNYIGQTMRSKYESGDIRTVEEFKEVLDGVLSHS